MTNRLAAFISNFKNHNKMGSIYFDAPITNICLAILNILRTHGLIQGFSFFPTKKKRERLFPRVRVYLKYSYDHHPCIGDLRIFKNTTSNYTSINRYKQSHFLSQRKLYVLSTPQGISLTSLDFRLQKAKGSNNPKLGGKVLVELCI